MYRLLIVAERMLEVDRTRTLPFVEEAVTHTRTENAGKLARLASGLSHCAAIAHIAGNEKGAKVLFAEAEVHLAKAIPNDLKDAATSWVAIEYFKVDRKKGLDLLSKSSGYYYGDGLNKILAYQAKTDIPGAIENLKLIRQDSHLSTYHEKILIALELVKSDPEAAIKLVESITTSRGKDCVQGYFELAKVVAQKDQPLAWKLLDEAFNRLEISYEFESYSNYGGSATAGAQIAHLTRTISPPEWESLFARSIV